MQKVHKGLAILMPQLWVLGFHWINAMKRILDTQRPGSDQLCFWALAAIIIVGQVSLTLVREVLQ
jgi:uncharacterized membrane protein